jgi:hypothetical protein
MNQWDSTQYIFTEEELMTLCLEAEVSFNAPTLETDPAAELNIVLAMLPLMLVARRSGKCIAITMDPVAISVSGWKWFGAPFLKPLIDEVIELAVTLGCLTKHSFDQGVPGRFYACHAEKQQFMHWLVTNNIVANGKAKVKKVFVCQTSIKACDNYKCFFRSAADHFKVQVVLNDTRYGPT